MAIEGPFLTDRETEKVILSLADARGDRGFSEEEALKAITEVEQWAFYHTLYKGVMDGHWCVDVNEVGEVIVTLPPTPDSGNK